MTIFRSRVQPLQKSCSRTVRSGVQPIHPEKGLTGSRSFGAKNNDPLEAIVFPGLFERLSWPGWGVRDERQRWGSKPNSWVKYHGKRGQNQRFSSIKCVDEALRFPPHHGLRKYRWLFFVRLLSSTLSI